MSLADEARALTSRQGSQCDMGLLLARLPQSDKSEIEEALADDTVEGTALARALKNRGIDVAAHTVNRHRRGDCSCH